MALELATLQDIPEIEALYRAVCRHEKTTPLRFPGWVEDVYPTRADAEEGLRKGTLYVLRQDGVIVGSVILNQDQPKVYETVAWFTPARADQVMVVHTFMVHPQHGGKGFGMAMLKSAEAIARAQGRITIRLDTSDLNLPAQGLYKKAGYRMCGIVDLGINLPDRRWFHCFDRGLGPF